MELSVPKEFHLFCVMYDQARRENVGAIEKETEYSLTYFTREQVVILKEYFDELLSGKYTAGRLTEIWESTPTAGGVTFFDGTDGNVEPGIVYALKAMRSVIEQRIAERA